MSFLSAASPLHRAPSGSSAVMLWVVLAAIPGLMAQTLFFGWGNLINVLWCTTLALGFEAVILKLRRRPVLFHLRDCSAVVTGLLLGLALPPLLPWWASLTAVAVAIILAKQLYGGLGYNPFNPAMVGYALVLISFPVAMTVNWAAPETLLDRTLSFFDTAAIIFNGASAAPDGWSMATPLDVYKNEIGSALATTVNQAPVFGSGIALGWEWVNVGFLAGGCLLLYRRIITWHIPAGVLGGLALLSLALGWDVDQNVPLTLHLFAGGTMLGVFFIATDPVSAATSNRGKLVFGAGIGVLVYLIRTWGVYPDAFAFAVLLMNFAAPFIDYYTKPRSYGHSVRQRTRTDQRDQARPLRSGLDQSNDAPQRDAAGSDVVTGSAMSEADHVGRL